MAKEETKPVQQKRYAVGQIPTATKEVLVDTTSNQPLIAEEGIALVLNEIADIKEQLERIFKKLA